MDRVQRSFGGGAFTNVGFTHGGVRGWFAILFGGKRVGLHSAWIPCAFTAGRQKLVLVCFDWP